MPAAALSENREIVHWAGLESFLSAIGGFVTSFAIIDVFWATLLGIVVGMLPGLTATLGVALMTTLTFQMEADRAILILICMYVGAIYGGSRSAILLNIPGTPANAATLAGRLSAGPIRPGPDAPWPSPRQARSSAA